MKIFDVRDRRVEEAVEAAARVIMAGGTLVYPDETGYVAAADPYRPEAAAFVYRAGKGQGPFAIAICVASGAELLEFVPEDGVAAIVVRKLLPDAAGGFFLPQPWFFAGLPPAAGIVFRVPEDALARALLERCGPLVACTTTYAGGDLDGVPNADVVLERGEVTPRREASVVDLTGERARLVYEAARMQTMRKEPFER